MGPIGCLGLLIAQIIHFVVLIIALPIILIGRVIFLICRLFGGHGRKM